MNFYKIDKRGIVGTIIFHLIILMMLLLLGFFTPLPLPEEEGVLVNFGTSDQGFGEIQPPASQQHQPATPPPPTPQTQPSVTPPPPPPTTVPEKAKEEVMTQDYEQTAAVDAAEKRREEEAERQRQLEAERIRRQQVEQQRINAERERQAELERERQAELERQRLAELERARQEELERQRKIAEIDSRAQGAFSGSTAQGSGTSQSQSQGATFPGGDQGVPTGDPNAGRYGPGGSGTGDQGSGISFSLSGRVARGPLPKPSYPGNDEGVVVVNITVDKNGNVTAAEPGARGTTIADQQFWSAARQAALKAKFNPDEDAPAFQTGTITYRFRLN